MRRKKYEERATQKEARIKKGGERKIRNKKKEERAKKQTVRRKKNG